MSAKAVVPADIDMSEARDAYLDAHRPIEAGSERHRELIEHFKSDSAVDVGGCDVVIEDLENDARPAWMGVIYGSVFGTRPPFPKVQGPSWATSYEDRMATPLDDLERAWSRTLRDDRFFTAVLERYDYFRFDTGTVEEGQQTLQVTIDRNDPIEFLTPAHAREAAQKLLAAADEWDALTADDEVE